MRRSIVLKSLAPFCLLFASPAVATGQDEVAASAASVAASAVETAAETPKPAWPFLIGPGKVDLTELCDRVALQLGRNYLRSEMDMGTVQRPSVQLQVPMSVRNGDELHAVFSQLVYSSGFCVVPVQSTLATYEVISLQGPRRVEISSRAVWRTADEILGMRDQYVPVHCVVPMRAASAQTATNALRPFFATGMGPGGSLTVGSIGDNRSVLLSGLAPHVAGAIQMLRAADAVAEESRSQLQQQLSALQEQVRRLQAARPVGGGR